MVSEVTSEQVARTARLKAAMATTRVIGGCIVKGIKAVQVVEVEVEIEVEGKKGSEWS